ncbi:MAG: hypothetical protein ACP6KW_11700 [Candidatus Thorarchaeota archaeon]
MVEEDKSPDEMAEELIDAIDEEADQDYVKDGLTPKEKEVHTKRAEERARKAQELRKQLRKRQLGILRYRWPAIILFMGGLLAILSEFLQVMTRDEYVPADVGFYNFIEAFSRTLESGSFGAVYLFPIVAGVLMIILSFFAYTNPKTTWLSLVPALLMAMSGGTVYFLITFAVTVQQDLTGHIYGTAVPISMFIVALLCLIAVWMREKE